MRSTEHSLKPSAAPRGSVFFEFSFLLHVHISVYIFLFVSFVHFTYIHACKHAYIHAYIHHAYIHTYIHTYVHTYILFMRSHTYMACVKICENTLPHTVYLQPHCFVTPAMISDLSSLYQLYLDAVFRLGGGGGDEKQGRCG
jgi:hypothetical protein